MWGWGEPTLLSLGRRQVVANQIWKQSCKLGGGRIVAAKIGKISSRRPFQVQESPGNKAHFAPIGDKSRQNPQRMLTRAAVGCRAVSQRASAVLSSLLARAHSLSRQIKLLSVLSPPLSLSVSSPSRNSHKNKIILFGRQLSNQLGSLQGFVFVIFVMSR